MNDARTLMVGIDGSDSSRDALAYALRDAAARGDQVRAVSVVAPPDTWAIAYGLPTMPTREGEFEAAKGALAKVVGEVVAEVGESVAEVPVETRVVAGLPAEVLVKEAAGVDVLVIGNRGRGRIASAVLGSVGLHCVLHAPCPVLIVRPVAGRAAR